MKKNINRFCNKAFRFIQKHGEKLLFRHTTKNGTPRGKPFELTTIPETIANLLSPNDTIWVEKNRGKTTVYLVC